MPRVLKNRNKEGILGLQMKNITLLIVFLFSVCLTAHADPCFGGTVASYIAASSCDFLGLTISGVTYQSSASGGASTPTAGSVEINPEIIAGRAGLLFSANWSAGLGEEEDSHIGLTVTCTECTIVDFDLILAGDAENSGSADIVGTSTSPIVNLTASTASLESLASFSPVVSIALMEHIQVSGGTATDGSAEISTVSSGFSTVSPIPEPRLGLLCLSGAVLIFLLRHRAKLHGSLPR
jgi:hypothetical protein